MKRKRLIRLTEGRLRGMIHEAVKSVLKEGTFNADEIEARLTDAFGDEAMLGKKSDDDMVTIITNPSTVDMHELNDIMIELGYMPYQKTKGYDAWTFINSKSADKYADGDVLKKNYGFDF